MPLDRRFAQRPSGNSAGFSLIEMLVSVAIIVILMSVIIAFLSFNQKVYQSQRLTSEVTQGGRNAFQVMTQDLNQAGYDPPFIQNRTIATGSLLGPGFTNLTLSCTSCGSTTTSRIFYGSWLTVGNNCGSGAANCDQEVVQVAGNTTNGLTPTSVPVTLLNTHFANEPVFDRNYPYPSGILYDNRPTSGMPGPYGIAANTIRFFGDLQGSTSTGDLYYGEYRLQCPGATAGTWIPACTTGCMAGPFTLTRFMSKLVNSSGVFSIPSSIATAANPTVSPIVNNIMGTCATGSSTWSQAVPDETSTTGTTTLAAEVSAWSGTTPSTYVNPVMNPDGVTPAIWLRMQTWGSCDISTSPCTPLYSTLVTDIQIQLTVQESSPDLLLSSAQPVQKQQVLQTHINPKNTNDAWGVAQNGGAALLPGTPVDPTTGYTLPLGCNYTAATSSCP